MILLFGACIAGPDFLLAGPAAQELAKVNGYPQGTGTVAGIIDGLGSLGAVMQGSATTFITQIWYRVSRENETYYTYGRLLPLLCYT